MSEWTLTAVIGGFTGFVVWRCIDAWRKHQSSGDETITETRALIAELEALQLMEGTFTTLQQLPKIRVVFLPLDMREQIYAKLNALIVQMEKS